MGNVFSCGVSGSASVITTVLVRAHISFFSVTAAGEASIFSRDKSILVSFDVSQTSSSLGGLLRLSFFGIALSDFSAISSFGEATCSGTDFDVSGLQTGLSVSESLSHSFKVSV